MTPTPESVEPQNEVLTVEELADFLRLSEETIYDKVSKGIIPHFRLGTGPQAHIRFYKQAILAWMQQPAP